jgi:peptidyl-prolyl cis-trans isomerase B (cyclophilin B)
VKYALAMARKSGINSAGSQFYLCLKDLPDLDTQYVVFGQTESGFATVDAMRKGDKIISMRVEK